MTVLYTAGSNFAVNDFIAMLDAHFQSTDYILLPQLEIVDHKREILRFPLIMLHRGNAYSIVFHGREDAGDFICSNEYLSQKLSDYFSASIPVTSVLVAKDDKNLEDFKSWTLSNIDKDQHMLFFTRPSFLDYLSTTEESSLLGHSSNQQNDFIAQALLSYATFYFQLDTSDVSSPEDDMYNYPNVHYYPKDEGQSVDVDFSPRYLVEVFSPYIEALDNLCMAIDSIRARPGRTIVIREITKRSPFSISISGVAETIQMIRDIVVPWKREHTLQSDNSQMAEATTQLALMFLNRIGVEASDDRKSTHVLQLIESLMTLVGTGLIPRKLGKRI